MVIHCWTCCVAFPDRSYMGDFPQLVFGPNVASPIRLPLADLPLSPSYRRTHPLSTPKTKTLPVVVGPSLPFSLRPPLEVVAPPPASPVDHPGAPPASPSAFPPAAFPPADPPTAPLALLGALPSSMTVLITNVPTNRLWTTVPMGHSCDGVEAYRVEIRL